MPNFSALTKDEAITLLKLVPETDITRAQGITMLGIIQPCNLTLKAAKKLNEVIKPTCQSGHTYT